LQPLVAVRRPSRTVAPSLTDGIPACWVGAGDAGALVRAEVDGMVVAAAAAEIGAVVAGGAIVVGGGAEGVNH
jgi:hypothetical protein